MKYRSTKDVVDDLAKHGKLVVVDTPLSPNLEIAEVQRRVYANGGPAVLFTHPIGCRFPMASNLFGSLEQARFLFRHTLDSVRRAIELKIDPSAFFKRPTRYWSTPFTAMNMRPSVVRSGSALRNKVHIHDLPQLISWPDDGGPFITLPQVLSMPTADPSEHSRASLSSANLGMYRVQLSGNDYEFDREVGLHYQLHRGIGIHHQQANAHGKPLQVTISVGGSPAMTLAAVMPLPEGLSELTFAGALAGYRIPMFTGINHAPIYADADFVITGEVALNEAKPEGPFGDHLGYYAKQHPFPVLKVQSVYHRDNAIWPFTVVGRPPQEDTTFGQLIHELTGPIIPTVLPGVRSVHAVDAAGVHPLLLAIGSERYTPYSKPDRPQELLTQACAILGQGQMSLAKYLLIADGVGSKDLNVHDVKGFLMHVLSRCDWRRDLHFHTCTTIDTLDYSGDALNQGSKVVIAAHGPPRRKLSDQLPDRFSLPIGYSNPRWIMPGILVIEAVADASCSSLVDHFEKQITTPSVGEDWNSIPWIVVVDDSNFATGSLKNFLWVTFTRSNPAKDTFGVRALVRDKHWGCDGPLVIDARKKIQHAAPLIESPEVSGRIDALAAQGKPISKYL